jgi:uncharacterized RDD family membrane protein YckC
MIAMTDGASAWSAPAPATDNIDEVMTGEAVALDVRPTGFVLRAAGTIIDFAVYLGGFFAISLLVSLATPLGADPALSAALVVAALVLSIVVAPIVVELATRGRSLGRLVVGARIVRDDGGAGQFRHAFIRALVGVLEIFLTVGGIAAIVGLLNGRAKRLGDLIAGTYSQQERVPKPRLSGLVMPYELSGWATIADVGRLPDRLSRRIAQFLDGAAAMTPVARAGLAAELAAEASPYVSPLPSVHPEAFLAGVAVLRRDREFRALESEARVLERLRPVLTSQPHGFPER